MMDEPKILFHIPADVPCVVAAYFQKTGDVVLTGGITLSTGAFPDGGDMTCLRSMPAIQPVYAVVKDDVALYWIANASVAEVANVLHNNGLAQTDLPPETITQMLLDMLFRFTEPWSLIGATTLTERRETL